MTNKIIQEHKKVSDKAINCRNRMMITNLVLVELLEGTVPIIYGICIAMAYFGPNSHILANIGNTYLGKGIENIAPVFGTMVILFSVDAMSVVINFFWL